ncbi:hypothetical protein PsYK624_105110 [Phanerochaete sordida]|uniref:Uncharacterized protein n=1 Tax=Phanerochaete sordida TaxID=48140 RepID=A0A9P3GER6_9APHY|nr:hypothetical protein PsYK624_105110 [Phanerochaete sordida]
MDDIVRDPEMARKLVEMLNDSLNNAREALEETEKDNDALRAEVAGLRSAGSSNGGTTSRDDANICEELRHAHEENARLKNEIADLRTTAGNIRGDDRGGSEGLECTGADCQARLDQHTQTIDELRQRIDEQDTELAQSAAAHAGFKRDLEQLEDALSAKDDACAALQARLDAARQHLALREQHLREKSEQLDTARERWRAAEDALATTTHKLQTRADYFQKKYEKYRRKFWDLADAYSARERAQLGLPPPARHAGPSTATFAQSERVCEPRTPAPWHTPAAGARTPAHHAAAHTPSHEAWDAPRYYGGGGGGGGGAPRSASPFYASNEDDHLRQRPTPYRDSHDTAYTDARASPAPTAHEWDALARLTPESMDRAVYDGPRTPRRSVSPESHDAYQPAHRPRTPSYALEERTVDRARTPPRPPVSHVRQMQASPPPSQRAPRTPPHRSASRDSRDAYQPALDARITDHARTPPPPPVSHCQMGATPPPAAAGQSGRARRDVHVRAQPGPGDARPAELCAVPMRGGAPKRRAGAGPEGSGGGGGGRRGGKRARVGVGR